MKIGKENEKLEFKRSAAEVRESELDKVYSRELYEKYD